MQAKICSCDFRSSCPFQPATRRITFYEYITSAGWEKRERLLGALLTRRLFARPCACNNKTVSFTIMDGVRLHFHTLYLAHNTCKILNKGVHTISPNHNKQALFFHSPNVHFVSQGCNYTVLNLLLYMHANSCMQSLKQNTMMKA
jgi:hypothetical protein